MSIVANDQPEEHVQGQEHGPKDQVLRDVTALVHGKTHHVRGRREQDTAAERGSAPAANERVPAPESRAGGHCPFPGAIPPAARLSLPQRPHGQEEYQEAAQRRGRSPQVPEHAQRPHNSPPIAISRVSAVAASGDRSSGTITASRRPTGPEPESSRPLHIDGAENPDSHNR